jgi:hypothetical protein
MTGVPIQQMADRVAGLMEERLHIPGPDLTEKLRRGGKRLPRKIRAAATVVAEAAVTAQNPKFLMQIDQEAVAKAYDTSVRYLGKLNAKERRIGALLDFGASVAFSLLVVAVVLFAVLRWRGFI